MLNQSLNYKIKMQRYMINQYQMIFMQSLNQTSSFSFDNLILFQHFVFFLAQIIYWVLKYVNDVIHFMNYVTLIQGNRRNFASWKIIQTVPPDAEI